VLTDYSGNVLPPPGWDLFDDDAAGKNVSIASDPTAPFSPSTVYQHAPSEWLRPNIASTTIMPGPGVPLRDVHEEGFGCAVAALAVEE
jgi:hypothetical protein